VLAILTHCGPFWNKSTHTVRHGRSPDRVIQGQAANRRGSSLSDSTLDAAGIIGHLTDACLF